MDTLIFMDLAIVVNPTFGNLAVRATGFLIDYDDICITVFLITETAMT
jgi:hypothetical protein